MLDAAYDAKLLAVVCDAANVRGSGRVFLTSLGGGAFGNLQESIGRAIARALDRLSGFELDVRIGYYRHIDERVHSLVGTG